MRRIPAAVAAALLLTLAACSDSAPPAATAPDAVRTARADDQRVGLIVAFRDDARDIPGLARTLTAANGGALGFTYQRALRGFSGSFPTGAADALRRHPMVAMVEVDQMAFTTATQSDATWGLDRIDQRALPRDNSYTYSREGTGVTAYIIDTGIRPTHNDLTGRVAAGVTYVNDGNGSNDCNGHGTHVAGTVGGTTWGVAKKVTLVPVRVFGCSGGAAYSTIISGVDWAIGDKSGPAVINMSLGGGASSLMDEAVGRAVSAGITVVVAAGNSNVNACNSSPARAPSAITVGATTLATNRKTNSTTDARASYSNYGSCLDLFAPGSGITSAWFTSNSATNSISGTSMASPHVAGAAALYLSGAPTATPAQVTSAIVGTATANVVGSAGRGSPNLLLYTGEL